MIACRAAGDRRRERCCRSGIDTDRCTHISTDESLTPQICGMAAWAEAGFLRVHGSQPGIDSQQQWLARPRAEHGDEALPSEESRNIDQESDADPDRRRAAGVGARPGAVYSQHPQARAGTGPAYTCTRSHASTAAAVWALRRRTGRAVGLACIASVGCGSMPIGLTLMGLFAQAACRMSRACRSAACCARAPRRAV